VSSLESLGFGPFASAFESLAPLAPARITSVLGSQLTIAGVAPERAELSGRLRHELRDEQRPTVGDWVAVSVDGHSTAIIHAVLPRKTQLLRRAAGTRGELQVVAANVDTFFVVTSANRDANPRRIERYLSAIAQSGASAVIVVNKIDLCPDPDDILASLAYLNVPVLGVSAATGANLATVTTRLSRGHTVAFVGMSGVGKSSLVNRLLDTARQVTLDIDDNDRGRHATTRRELVLLPDDRGIVIDTPGMRSFGLTDEEGLAEIFDDITSVAASCRFRDCRHENEPGCAVGAALDDGTLDPARLAAFEKLEREAQAAERRRDPMLARQAKQRWRAVHMEQRTRAKHDPKRSR
jgi:ribosome biogenesis GTPase